MADKPKNWNQMSWEDKALWEYMNAGDEFTQGGAPQYTTGSQLDYQQLDPNQLAKLRQSGMADVSTDPRYAQAQIDALNQLEQVSKEGMTARDKADMAKLEADTNRRNAGRMGAIQQNMASRGMSGSGMDLVAQMQAAQDATDREAMAALEKNAQIGERKQQATMQRGQLAGDMRNESFSEQARKAEAQDAIDRFNAANSVQTQMQNNRGINDTNQTNWNRTNQTNDRNAAAQYDYRKDKMGVEQGNQQFAYNKATDDWNRAQLKKQAKGNRARNMFSGAAQGAAAGAAVGGPWGAAAGGILGAAANYAQGKVRGEAPFPGNDPRNDLYPAMVSADEIIVPREEAQDPAAAASFAAQAASDPFASIKNPTVREYMRQKAAAKKELEDAQSNQKWMGVANAVGKIGSDALNNRAQDVVLKNRMQDLGAAPKVSQAKRVEWDGSVLDKLGAMGVDKAKGKLAQAGQDFGDNMKVQEYERQEVLRDPKSKQSLQAQLLARSALASKAKEAEMAGDIEAATNLKGIDVSNMSAVEAKDFYDQIKGTDYKDILNIKARAEDRAAAREQARLMKELAADQKRTDNEDKAVERMSKTVAGVQDTANAIDRVERQLGNKLDDLQVVDGKLYNKNNEEIDLPGVSLPGVGRVSAYSGSARQLASAIGTVFNTELKDRSGAAVTNNEMERLKNEFGSGKFNTEAELIQALKDYKTAMVQELKNREAGFSPNVRETYKGRGGQTSDRYNQAPAAPSNQNKPSWAK